MKLNEQGEYLPFAGVTVISPVLQENAQFWNELHALLSDPIILKYFTPLPAASYHMTTNNLCVEARQTDWLGFIDRNLYFFTTLSDNLVKAQFKPEVRITNVTTRGAIQLTVDFCAQKQEEAIYKIADHHNCTDGIPSPFHITLAYQYQHPISDKDKTAFKTAIRAIKEKTRNYQVTLNPPALHVFKDMTQYTPWDGMNNPFQPLLEESEESMFSSNFRFR